VWRFESFYASIFDTYDTVMDHATPQIATRRNQRLAGYLR